MISDLDRLLRSLLMARVPQLTAESQIRFQPPDETWRETVSNLDVQGEPAIALNVYLAELSQLRELRSNERTRTITDGLVTEHRRPEWMRCLYLLSAWSPASSEQVEPTLDEHALLHAVATALTNAAPLNAARILPAGSPALAALPAPLRNLELPTEVMPVGGFTKLAEFWSSMGAGHRWKPVVALTVGVPLLTPDPGLRGHAVTTVVLNLGVGESRDGGWVQLGGRVLGPGGTPVAGARVTVLASAAPDPPAELAHAVSETATGRFLVELPLSVLTGSGQFELRAEAGELAGSIPLDLQRPTHDVLLTPVPVPEGRS
jgi:hypothetical protein